MWNGRSYWQFKNLGPHIRRTLCLNKRKAEEPQNSIVFDVHPCTLRLAGRLQTHSVVWQTEKKNNKTKNKESRQNHWQGIAMTFTAPLAAFSTFCLLEVHLSQNVFLFLFYKWKDRLAQIWLCGLNKDYRHLIHWAKVSDTQDKRLLD